MNLDKLILFIKCINGVGDSSIRRLIMLNRFEGFEPNGLDDVLSFLKMNADCFTKKKYIQDLSLDDVREANIIRQMIERRSEGCGVKYISYYNELYPTRMKDIRNTKAHDFPVILYYKGDISVLNNERTCSVIGTRKASRKAIDIGLSLSKRMAEKGYVVISGLAEGCDTTAHIGCLEGKGKTVAIVGTGLDVVYPKSNEPLLEDILSKGGAVISEYPVGFSGASYSFVSRDRLQAAAADIVIPIQTSVEGGTMHAVKAAIEYERRVSPVDPRLVDDGDATGNQKIIEQYGATPIDDEWLK